MFDLPIKLNQRFGFGSPTGQTFVATQCVQFKSNDHISLHNDYHLICLQVRGETYLIKVHITSRRPPPATDSDSQHPGPTKPAHEGVHKVQPQHRLVFWLFRLTLSLPSQTNGTTTWCILVIKIMRLGSCAVRMPDPLCLTARSSS